jgi:nickel/cobalt exporter
VIGLPSLFANLFIVPDVLVPGLEVVSGVLVVVMGGRLIWQRWSVFQAQRAHDHAHAHGLDHHHDHAHDHVHADGLTHDHGDGHVHTHLPPDKLKLGGLLAMGISGGLVPCPEALGIMIIAVGLHRIELGLGLIVAFSLGLAAVLITLGILLVHSRALVDRFGKVSGRFVTGLPLGSAVLVTLLGAGIMLAGVSSYMR